jgi:hypothetical protein
MRNSPNVEALTFAGVSVVSVRFCPVRPKSFLYVSTSVPWLLEPPLLLPLEPPPLLAEPPLLPAPPLLLDPIPPLLLAPPPLLAAPLLEPPLPLLLPEPTSLPPEPPPPQAATARATHPQNTHPALRMRQSYRRRARLQASALPYTP